MCIFAVKCYVLKEGKKRERVEIEIEDFRSKWSRIEADCLIDFLMLQRSNCGENPGVSKSSVRLRQRKPFIFIQTFQTNFFKKKFKIPRRRKPQIGGQ
jgi:hypothetical protein